jgi:hypothetical protein
MTSHHRLCAATLLFVISLSPGCALWWPAKGQTKLAFLQMEANLPESWMIASFSQGTFLTRHGLELQSIHIRRWKRTDTVKGTNRSIEDGMLPQEIAELSLDSRRLDDGVGGLRVNENSPVVIDGRDCYRIVYEFRNEPGLLIRTMEYGCAVGPWMYRLEYRAAAQHYYETYLPDFERLRQSARFAVK